MKKYVRSDYESAFGDWDWHDASNGDFWNRWVYCLGEDWPKLTDKHDYGVVEQKNRGDAYRAYCCSGDDGFEYEENSFDSVDAAMEWVEDNIVTI